MLFWCTNWQETWAGKKERRKEEYGRTKAYINTRREYKCILQKGPKSYSAR